MSAHGDKRQPAHIALCDDDRCPWKYRGVTGERTAAAAHEHALSAGHVVTLYDDHTKVGKV